MQARSAYSFTRSIGVGTHVASGSGYRGVARTIQDLNYLGIKLARMDVNLDRIDWARQIYDATGVKWSCIFRPGYYFGTFDQHWDKLVQRLEIIDSVEGANEPEVTPCIFNECSANLLAAKAHLNTLYSRAKDYNIPVYCSSIGYYNIGSVPGMRFDCINMHSYPMNYDALYTLSSPRPTNLKAWFDLESAYYKSAYPGKDIVVTEVGWSTCDYSPGGFILCASNLVSAKYTLNAPFNLAASGVKKMFFYELNDASATPAPGGAADTERENNFGLMYNDGTPKPSGTAIKNMLALLSDAQDFTPTDANFIVSTAAPNVRTLLLQKQNGEYWLAIWNEVSIWNKNPPTGPAVEVTVADVTADISFGSTKNYAVYSPLTSQTAVSSGSASSLSLAVKPYVQLVKIA